MKHEYILTVRSTDVDMIGHVNNAKYLEYLEWARFDWLKQHGVTVESFRKWGIFPVVVNVNINYRKELLFDEEILITSYTKKMNTRSVVAHQIITNQAGDVIADADLTIVAIDGKKRKAITLPDDMKTMFEKTIVE
ncbi:thioesterase family protein [Mechercharimyces sp. CAU 1602]|uniref:acyl-CoA thioesterase n=1 Tax=Mechercharimyces sp. CAU 1602 TaxID=2973933 RepID=UPI00216306C8|nr:thioesterase family protein [Mechercharimyces sp. CAU 1602]MCS1350270.1 acyl-CoA thioesterase [Mechercharimyces sp. CAU 1602]